MVHHEVHALGMGIVVQGLDVKVWVWCLEVEDIIFLVACPVFPADVPSLDKNLVETIGCRKVYIASDLSVVGAVCAVGLHF